MPVVCSSGKKIITFILLYYFLFTQYLYAEQTSCHIRMVAGNAIAIMTQR
jgi:hypothetical protein